MELFSQTFPGGGEEEHWKRWSVEQTSWSGLEMIISRM